MYSLCIIGCSVVAKLSDTLSQEYPDSNLMRPCRTFWQVCSLQMRLFMQQYAGYLAIDSGGYQFHKTERDSVQFKSH